MRRLLRILLIFVLMTGSVFSKGKPYKTQNSFKSYFDKEQYNTRVEGCVAGILSYIRQEKSTPDVYNFCYWSVGNVNYSVKKTKKQPKLK